MNEIKTLKQKKAIDEKSETKANHHCQNDDGQNTKYNTKKICSSTVGKNTKYCAGQLCQKNDQSVVGKFNGWDGEKNNEEDVEKNDNVSPNGNSGLDKDEYRNKNRNSGNNRNDERNENTKRPVNKIFKDDEIVCDDQDNKNNKSIKKNGIDKNHKIIKPKIIAFWRPTDPNGYLGQWYLSDFKFTVDDFDQLPEKIGELGLFTDRIDVVKKMMIHKYNCTEQFMMMGKAALFNDDDIFNKMSQNKSPRYHKVYGRNVRGFDDETWDKYSKDIVILGNYLKFTQNQVLLDKLRGTIGFILIEGSPMDRIWGVGIKYDDPSIIDKSKWQGKNYLGQCLEFVRDCLFCDLIM